MPAAGPVILNVAGSDGERRARTRLLRRAGFTVREARSGCDALEQMRILLPEVVVLDVIAGDPGGTELCRRIKSDGATAGVMVLQTAPGGIGDADHYLATPFDAAELIAGVNALWQLGEARRQLRDAELQRDAFVATLAHELRNPLGPMRNAVELLRLGAADECSIHREAREIIARQIDHMARLVDDLVDVARITRGRLALRLRRVTLDAVVEPALEMVRPLIEERGQTLELQLPERAVWLYGDAVRLSQLLGNLLHNAARFTPRGGHVQLAAAVYRRHLLLTVRDSGIGIDAGRLEHIFEPFVQLAPDAGDVQQGLGVGLSLVKQLVELHGGQVHADSDGRGRGSIFTVDLPIALADAGADAKPAPAARAPAPLRILLVDDSPDAVNMLKALLETLGCEVAAAHDGAGALALVERFAPQVILLDIGLPGMDGYAVARELHSRAPRGLAVLAALTGYGYERGRALAAGFTHHLTKPLDLDELRTLLQHAGQAQLS